MGYTYYTLDSITYFPDAATNSDYITMLEEVEAETAEIVDEDLS